MNTINTMNKQCGNCKETKLLDEFHKKSASKDGYKSICKSCTSEYKKIYRQENSDRIKEYRQNNKEKIKIQHREYMRTRARKDNIFKLCRNIGTMFRNSFRRQGFSKSGNSREILGCNFEEFRKYIESKFEPWMTWDNYGLYNGELNYGWDIDHIIPTCSADSEEVIIKLNHYTNLQPLCSKVNRDIKRGKF
jgi:hypothetical protein